MIQDPPTLASSDQIVGGRFSEGLSTFYPLIWPSQLSMVALWAGRGTDGRRC